MNELQQEALEEMKTTIHKWFDEQENRTNVEEVVLRTTLQVGIFNFVMLDYRPGRTRVNTSKSMGSAAGKKSMKVSPFTREEVLHEVQPLLVEIVRERLEKVEKSPLINYQFTFQGSFATTDGLVELTVLETVYEEKKRQLLERIQSYIEEKLEKGVSPTHRRETFFLARHLLDPYLFPEPDAAKTIALFDRIQELNKQQVEDIAEHRRDIIWALTDWVENVFLPRYCDITRNDYGAAEYEIKPGAVLENKDEPNQPIDLLLYGAVMIIRYEPNYSKYRGRLFWSWRSSLAAAKPHVC